MNVRKRDAAGGGPAPKNTVNQMKPKGVSGIKNSVGWQPKPGKGLGAIKGAVTAPNRS